MYFDSKLYYSDFISHHIMDIDPFTLKSPSQVKTTNNICRLFL